MSDEALRALERAFAARPERDTRGALVAALARVGERRRALALLAEAARGGDAEAQSALDGWHPWYGPGGAGGRRVSPGALAGPLAEVASSGHPLELVKVLGATAADLLLLGRDERTHRVLALDPVTLAARWSIEVGPLGQAALVGEDVVVTSRTRLRTHSPEDGALRGELALPAEVRGIVGADDRVVVLLCAPDRTRLGLACVDLRGPAPALAWRRDAPDANTPLVVLGDRVEASRVCVHLSDGSPAPPLEAYPPGRLRHDPSLYTQWLLLHLAEGEHELLAQGVSVLGTSTRTPERRPELVSVARGSRPVTWRRPLPAWAGGKGARVSVAAAGNEVLVLLSTEERVALLVVAAADGTLLREVPTTLRGRSDWDHRDPGRPSLVVVGDGVVGLVPAPKNHFVQVVRLAGASATAAPRRRGPLPGSPTPVLGAREAFEADASVWRTADGRAVLPAATTPYAHVWGKSTRLWPSLSGSLALLTLGATVLEPEPERTHVALLVDLTRRAVVALPLAGALRCVALVPAGLVLAEGAYSRESEFEGSSFDGCRLSGWEVPSGRPAFVVPLKDACATSLTPRADGTFEAVLEVEREGHLRWDELARVSRVLDPGVPGWGAAPGAVEASSLVELAVEWPTPAARAVLEVRREGADTEVLVLAAELPDPGSPRATRGDVVATWFDEELVRVTRGGVEVARLTLPADVRGARNGRRASPEGDVRYVAEPPAVLGLSLDGAHVLAVVVPGDPPVKSWSAVVWSLDEPDAPLGQVVLGPAFLPPPRAVLAAPVGRLRLDLGRGVALVARHGGPLDAVAWAATGDVTWAPRPSGAGP